MWDEDALGAPQLCRDTLAVPVPAFTGAYGPCSASAAPQLYEQGCLCPPSLWLPWHAWHVFLWLEELAVGGGRRLVALRWVFGVGQGTQGGGSAGSSMTWHTSV